MSAARSRRRAIRRWRIWWRSSSDWISDGHRHGQTTPRQRWRPRSSAPRRGGSLIPTLGDCRGACVVRRSGGASGCWRERFVVARGQRHRQLPSAQRFRWRSCRSGTRLAIRRSTRWARASARCCAPNSGSRRRCGPLRRIACIRCSRICAFRRMRRWRRPNWRASPTSRARDSVLWGQYARFGDAIRIDATLQDLDRAADVALNAMAPNEGELLTAIPSSPVRCERPGSRIPRHPERTQIDRLQAVDQLVRGVALYNEGVRLVAAGHTPGGAQEVSKRRPSGRQFRAGIFRPGPAVLALGYDSEADQFSRQAMSLARRCHRRKNISSRPTTTGLSTTPRRRSKRTKTW